MSNAAAVSTTVGATATSSTMAAATTSSTTSAGGGSPSTTTASTSTTAGQTLTTGAGGATTSGVLDALREYLAIERAARPPLGSQDFAQQPLSAAEAEAARSLLWADYAAFITSERQVEADAQAIVVGAHTLLYDFTVFGDKPAGGRSLFISLHGGGEAAASVNDQQWENQKSLYQPEEGIYLAPRAPTNTWNLWHEPHIDALLDRLITNFVVLEDVDPNRIYVMGYSAGGDGVYQLGPRMADRWAAAAMMAGHPNDAQPDSLRNIGFTIHVGGLDTAYDRNLVAEQWGMLLDELEAGDLGGYPHHVEIHPDKPHWMDLEDAVAIPWMAGFTRNPLPQRVVWLQDDVTHDRFYWLAVETATAGARIEANVAQQAIELQASGASRVTVRLSDAMLDLDQPVSIVSGGNTVYEGMVNRSILTLFTSTEERGDPSLVFSGEVALDLP
jgi:hypothetical protein